MLSRLQKPPARQIFSLPLPQPRTLAPSLLLSPRRPLPPSPAPRRRLPSLLPGSPPRPSRLRAARAGVDPAGRGLPPMAARR